LLATLVSRIYAHAPPQNAVPLDRQQRMSLPRIPFTISLALLLASSAKAQVQDLPGCYSLVVSEWSPAIGADSVYHRIPLSVVLDTTPRGRGWVMTPDIAYPGGNRFRTTPRWEAIGDTLVLTWSNGYVPTVLRLVAHGPDFVGEAIALSDAHPVPEPPRPRAQVRARRQPCKG
jgi:hypothetical protein